MSEGKNEIPGMTDVNRHRIQPKTISYDFICSGPVMTQDSSELTSVLGCGKIPCAHLPIPLAPAHEQHQRKCSRFPARLSVECFHLIVQRLERHRPLRFLGFEVRGPVVLLWRRVQTCESLATEQVWRPATGGAEDRIGSEDRSVHHVQCAPHLGRTMRALAQLQDLRRIEDRNEPFGGSLVNSRASTHQYMSVRGT